LTERSSGFNFRWRYQKEKHFPVYQEKDNKINKQLERIVDRRIKNIKELIHYIWENRKEIIENKKKTINTEQHYFCFRDYPGRFIPQYFCKDIDTDTVNKIQELLETVIEDYNCKIIKSHLVEIFI